MLRKTAYLLPLALLILSCGSGGGLFGPALSIQEEWQLGDQMAAQVAQEVRLVNDPQALAYVRMVGERIHARTPQANLPYTFHIVEDPSVNAFTLPGGHVYINTGLIAQADKVNMLAGVMAHEIAHVTQRHIAKKVGQAQGISVIGTILLGQNPGALQQIAAQIIAGGAMARFSRSDEKEADDVGLEYLRAAGYNPHGMLDMFQKLLALEQGGNNAVSKFFADHPGTTDRIKDISGRIASMGRTTGIVDDPAYQSDLQNRM